MTVDRRVIRAGSIRRPGRETDDGDTADAAAGAPEGAAGAEPERSPAAGGHGSARDETGHPHRR